MIFENQIQIIFIAKPLRNVKVEDSRVILQNESTTEKKPDETEENHLVMEFYDTGLSTGYVVPVFSGKEGRVYSYLYKSLDMSDSTSTLGWFSIDKNSVKDCYPMLIGAICKTPQGDLISLLDEAATTVSRSEDGPVQERKDWIDVERFSDIRDMSPETRINQSEFYWYDQPLKDGKIVEQIDDNRAFCDSNGKIYFSGYFTNNDEEYYGICRLDSDESDSDNKKIVFISQIDNMDNKNRMSIMPDGSKMLYYPNNVSEKGFKFINMNTGEFTDIISDDFDRINDFQAVSLQNDGTALYVLDNIMYEYDFVNMKNKMICDLSTIPQFCYYGIVKIDENTYCFSSSAAEGEGLKMPVLHIEKKEDTVTHNQIVTSTDKTDETSHSQEQTNRTTPEE